jgi:hypothetical protein
MWKRREIENYLCCPEALSAWAKEEGGQKLGPLFAPGWQEQMTQAVGEIETAMATLGKGSPWSPDTKVSDDFLDPLFVAFFKRLSLPNLMRKSDYHVLARHVPADRIDPEITQVLNAVLEVSGRANPAREEDGA